MICKNEGNLEHNCDLCKDQNVHKLGHTKRVYSVNDFQNLKPYITAAANVKRNIKSYQKLDLFSATIFATNALSPNKILKHLPVFHFG